MYTYLIFIITVSGVINISRENFNMNREMNSANLSPRRATKCFSMMRYKNIG